VKYPAPETGSVWIYDPKTDTFSAGAPMPAGRERGAGGVAFCDAGVPACAASVQTSQRGCGGRPRAGW